MKFDLFNSRSAFVSLILPKDGKQTAGSTRRASVLQTEGPGLYPQCGLFRNHCLSQSWCSVVRSAGAAELLVRVWLGWLSNFLPARFYRTRIDTFILDTHIVFLAARQSTATYSNAQQRAAQRSAAQRNAAQQSTAQSTAELSRARQSAAQRSSEAQRSIAAHKLNAFVSAAAGVPVPAYD